MKKDKIAIIGLGYVGLPLARLFATNYSVVGSFGDTGSASNVTGCVRYYGALSTAHTKITVNYTYDGGRAFYDYSRVYLHFFGN